MDLMSISNMTLEDWIKLTLANFALAMLILAVLFILVHKLISGRRLSTSEIVYRWIAFFPLGLSLIFAFVMHAFYSEQAASHIGWQTSPFQFEVAMADLALGVLGVLSFRASYGFRLATVVATAIYFWGDAIGHIYQIFEKQNYTVGNAGSWLWMDILIPVILIICIVRLRPGKLMVV